MNDADRKAYNEAIEQINKTSPSELDAMLREGRCPYPVERLGNVPLGMFHCEICGTMVVAGLPHGPLDPPWDPEKSLMCSAFYKAHPELRP